MATCKHDAIRGGLDELTVDKLMENVQVSDKSAKDLVEDLVNEQVEATFQERSNVVNINRGRRFIENAKVTAENTKRPFKKFWKYFFDDKNSVGVRVTTRIQRRLADIASETNIPIHDFFKLIEGSIIDRVNDRRNVKQITPAELTRLFKQSFKKYGKKIAKLGPDAEAVINDMKTDINMPFVLNLKGGELELVAKTVMRKKNFQTSGPKMSFEEFNKEK